MAEFVHLPRLSQDMTQGRIVQWLKREGDAVKEGEPLVSIESDKAEVELQAPRGGILRRVLIGPGQDAEVGTPVAILGTADEDIEVLAAKVAAPRTAAPQPGPGVPAARPSLAAAPAAGSGKRQPVSPAARRLARELGVDLARVAGTGPGGMVTEADVQAAAAPAPAAEDDVEVVPLTGIRRRIAERLALSRRTAADVTTVMDVDMTEVAGLRTQSGFSYTAYVAWAAAQSLREFPVLNASLVEDRILRTKTVHLGVAVALDQGLVVPVIRGAERKSVDEIAAELQALATRAREGTLGPEELRGSTFTLTNSGGFGSLLFTPIINAPEVGILGMGKVADTPVVRDGAIVVRKVMYLCLSYDHRAVDGAPAVQFLHAVKTRLEEPRGT